MRGSGKTRWTPRSLWLRVPPGMDIAWRYREITGRGFQPMPEHGTDTVINRSTAEIALGPNYGTRNTTITNNLFCGPQPLTSDDPCYPGVIYEAGNIRSRSVSSLTYTNNTVSPRRIHQCTGTNASVAVAPNFNLSALRPSAPLRHIAAGAFSRPPSQVPSGRKYCESEQREPGRRGSSYGRSRAVR
jgi:hypothetical protein